MIKLGELSKKDLMVWKKERKFFSLILFKFPFSGCSEGFSLSRKDINSSLN